MQHGPHGQKCPDSPTQAAIQVARITTGETVDKEAPSNRRTLKVLPARKGKATDQRSRPVG